MLAGRSWKRLQNERTLKAMSSKPIISFNPRGDVTMSVESNGFFVHLRFPPKVAMGIAKNLVDSAEGAIKMMEAAEKELGISKERIDTYGEEMRKRMDRESAASRVAGTVAGFTAEAGKSYHVGTDGKVTEHDCQVADWEAEGGSCG